MNLPGFESIRLEDQGPVTVLTLHRPDRLNAINRKMIAEIDAALDFVEDSQRSRVLVVHGAGRAFCSGYDLEEDAGIEVEDSIGWRKVLQRQFDFILRFWDLSIPTIAATHGYCLAFGCELSLACDLTVAAEGTLFGEPELKFGSGILVLLMPWLMNPKQAKELLLLGNDRVDAYEAHRLGMVNKVVPEGEHLVAAIAMARQIALMDPDALRLTRGAINRSYEIMGLRAALAVGLDHEIQIESLSTPDRQRFREILMREGVKAALSWREARFRGSL